MGKINNKGGQTNAILINENNYKNGRTGKKITQSEQKLEKHQHRTHTAKQVNFFLYIIKIHITV